VLDDRGVRVPAGAHPAFYPMGIRGSFPGGKADHSSPSSANVKKAWSYTSTPPNTSSWRGDQLKHRDNFTFLLLKGRSEVAQSIQTINYGLDDWGSIPSKGSDGIFSLRYRFQTCSGAHPASYIINTGGGGYPGGKTPGA
jgi:hypothetical protein